MSFSFKKSFKTALRSSWVILKLIVPIYILADILFYYDLLRHITFIFKPFAVFLGLPQEAALSIVSGLFLNLYAAIAFAAPLGLGAKEWTILAVFLGIAHALLVETEIMKRLGISRLYSIILRLSVGLCVGFLVTLMPNEWFSSSVTTSSETLTPVHYDSLKALILNASYEALSLSIKIIALVSLLIFVLDVIKAHPWMQKHSQNVNSGFSILVGVILGITYGAGILIAEYEKGILKKREVLFYRNLFNDCPCDD